MKTSKIPKIGKRGWLGVVLFGIGLITLITTISLGTSPKLFM